MTAKEKLINVLQDINIIELNEKVSDVLEYISKNDIEPFRAGQYLFNTLYQYWPQIADCIRGTELDMFYRDDIIEKFVKVIDEVINNV